MARSERYIPPTAAQRRAMEEAHAARLAFDAERSRLLATALGKQRKNALAELVARLSDENIHARWLVESAIDLHKPVALMVHDLHQAIDLASRIDELRLNYNFDYDSDAYAEVKRLLESLVRAGALSEAMEASVRLMSQASQQIASSDEGLMLPEIEACLHPVLAALADFDASARAAWALRMLCADSVGVICDVQLRVWAGLEP